MSILHDLLDVDPSRLGPRRPTSGSLPSQAAGSTGPIPTPVLTGPQGDSGYVSACHLAGPSRPKPV
jgi:hypothetical protein